MFIQSCSPGINNIRSCSSFLCFLDLVSNILLRISVSMFKRDTSLQFSCIFLVWFDIRIILASYNELGLISSSSLFWKMLCRICVDFSLNIWQNCPEKPSGPGDFFKFDCSSVGIKLKFNFLNIYRAIKNINFTWCEFWQFASFQEKF